MDVKDEIKSEVEVKEEPKDHSDGEDDKNLMPPPQAMPTGSAAKNGKVETPRNPKMENKPLAGMLPEKYKSKNNTMTS